MVYVHPRLRANYARDQTRILEKAGKVIDAQIAYDENQDVKGEALVTYSTKEEAIVAMQTLDNVKCSYNPQPFQVKASTTAIREEIAHSMGNISKDFQSIEFLDVVELSYMLTKSITLNRAQRQLCEEWVQHAHTIVTAWNQAKKNIPWERSNRSMEIEDWNKHLMHENGLNVFS